MRKIEKGKTVPKGAVSFVSAIAGISFGKKEKISKK